SGCPSAVRGVGLLDFTSTAVSSCEKPADERANMRPTKKKYFFILLSSRTAIARRCSRDNTPIRQCHTPRIHHSRAVLRAIAIDDNRVAQLDIAALEAASCQRARGAGLTTPSHGGAALVFRIDIEISVGIRPFDLCESSSHAQCLAPVELCRKR